MPLAAAAATAATAWLDQESVLSLDLKDEDDDVLNDLAETCASLDDGTYVGKLMETSVEMRPRCCDEAKASNHDKRTLKRPRKSHGAKGYNEGRV